MALFGFLGKVLGARSRAREAKRARNFNQHQSALDRQFQLDMMNRTNAHQIALSRETHARNVAVADRNYERQKADALNERATRIQTLVADANAAGINPVTALRGGAPAAAMPGMGTPLEDTPILSHGNFTPSPLVTPDFGNAQMWEGLGDETDRWFQERRAREHDEEMAQLQKEVLQEQINTMRKRNSVASSGYFGFGMPHANTTARTDYSTGSLSNGVPSGSLGNKVFGVDVVENPNMSDAEDIEARYGDLISSLYGLVVAGADARDTFKRKVESHWDNSGLKRIGQELYSRSSATWDRLRNWRPTTYHDLPPPPLSRRVPKGLRGDRARRKHPLFKR